MNLSSKIVILFIILDQEWRLIHGRPSLIGPLISRGFYDWVKSELYADVLDRVKDDYYYQPHSSVPTDLHWLSVFVNDKMMDINPYNDPDSAGIKDFYIGLERVFDCSEINCAFHHTWYFHCKRIDLDDETIQGSHDTGCLQWDFEAWIESFLELRFPSISFDYESLVAGNTLPRLRINHTY